MYAKSLLELLLLLLVLLLLLLLLVSGRVPSVNTSF